MNWDKKTWRKGTKYGIENLAIDEEKTVCAGLDRVRSAISMYVNRNGLNLKFKTAINKSGLTVIKRVQ